MRIIIATEIPVETVEKENEEEIVQPPVEVGKPFPAPEPVSVPKPKDERQEFYDKLDALHKQYVMTKDELLFEQIANLSFPDGRTVRNYLGKEYYRKHHPANRNLTQDQADQAGLIALFKALNRADPKKRFTLGYVDFGLQHEITGDPDVMPMMTSKYFGETYGRLVPYFQYLSNHERGEKKAGQKIDDDIMGQYDEGKIGPSAAAAEQWKRDNYRDDVVPDDKEGRRRIQWASDHFKKAYEWVFDQEKQNEQKRLELFLSKNPRVSRLGKDGQVAVLMTELRKPYIEIEHRTANDPKIRKISNSKIPWKLIQPMPPVLATNIDDADALSLRIKEIGEKTKGTEKQQAVSVFSNQDSNFWLTPEMVSPRLGKGIGKELWEHFQTQQADQYQKSFEVPFAEEPTTEAPKFERFRTEEEDNPNQNIETVYRSFLDDPFIERLQEEDPKALQTIQERLGLILPFEETKPGEYKLNLNFKPVLEHILTKLYGPGSRPITSNEDIDKRTKRVLNAIGTKFIETIGEGFRPSAVEEDIAEDLPNIVVRNLTEEQKEDLDPDNAEQMQQVALAEVMKDIFDFIRDDQNHQEIVRMLGRGTTASLLRMIRTAIIINRAEIMSMRRC